MKNYKKQKYYLDCSREEQQSIDECMEAAKENGLTYEVQYFAERALENGSFEGFDFRASRCFVEACYEWDI